MKGFRFYLDADVHPRVARSLRRKGIDAVSAHERRMHAADDREQLSLASREGRVILTFNVAHFVRLHMEYVAGQREHAGIIVSRQLPIGEVVRRLVSLMQSIEPGDLRNVLHYLSSWPPAVRIPDDLPGET